LGIYFQNCRLFLLEDCFREIEDKGEGFDL
jgi:hypothetical protein